MRPALLIITALVLLLGPARPAGAQALPPSLTADTNYAFGGIAKYDFAAGISTDEAYGSAVDPALDRYYAVGETAGDAGNVAVVARRGNGELDRSFAGDGSLSLPITIGARDFGTALAVLPDHRLRVVGATTDSDLDIAIAGLLPDGQPDPDFGDEGISTFPVAPAGDDVPARVALDGLGRLAITGWTQTGLARDTFVALRAADGSPVAGFGTDGIVVLDRGGPAVEDRGVDVVWRNGTPLVLIQIGPDPVPPAPGLRESVLHSFTATGDDDTTFSSDGDALIDLGGTDTVPGGLTTYDDGRIWLTGAVQVDDDRDAYLARLAADGSGLESRRFDMSGTVFPSTQAVDSEGLDLTVVRGEPDAIVVGGSAKTDGGPEWAGMAFNGLDGPVSALQTGDLVIPVTVSGEGRILGVEGGADGAVAAVGSLRDFSIETSSGTDDTSIGMARLVVDAEKQCDLGLAITNPLELVLRGVNPSPVTFRVTNAGKRACAGTITAPAPYAMAPATIPTGKLGPGASVVLTALLGYTATFPADDTVAFSLLSPTDAQPGDNVVKLHVLFSYCDLELHFTGAPKVLGKEGARRFEFSVRNLGTATCSRANISVGGTGRRITAGESYTVPAGQSVTDEFDVGLRRTARVGGRARVVFTAIAKDDVRADNNTITASPKVVRAGDTNAQRPDAGKRFHGTAKRGGGAGVRKRALEVARVEIAVRKRGRGCHWLSDAGGRLRKVVTGAKGACDEPVWVKTRTRGKHKSAWSLQLRRALPKGRYTLLSRAVLVNGVPEGAFSAKDHNKVNFSVG